MAPLVPCPEPDVEIQNPLKSPHARMALALKRGIVCESSSIIEISAILLLPVGVQTEYTTTSRAQSAGSGMLRAVEVTIQLESWSRFEQKV